MIPRTKPYPLPALDARPDTPSNYPSPGPSPTPNILFRRDGLDAGQTDPSRLRPWLGLRARLFLSLFSPALIALLFVLAQLLLALADVGDRARDAKAALLSRCRDAESAASYAWSVPHYAAAAVNRQTKEAIEASVREVGRVLSLAIEAIEQTLLFIVNSYRSLFVCFIELLVRGSLALLIAAVDLLNEAVQDVASGLKAALQASVGAANAILAGTVAGINDVAGIIGKHINPPQIQTPSLSALDHVSLPSAFDAGLRSLNASLPTLSELKAKMDGVIQQPFEKLKMDINQTVATFTFTPTPLPVPTRQSLSFCSDKLDSTPLDDIAADLRKTLHVALWIVGLGIVLVVIACAVKEWYVWRAIKSTVARTRQAYQLAHGDDETRRSLDEKSALTVSLIDDDARLFSLIQLSTHPLLAVVGLKMGRSLGVKSAQGQARLRWWLAWVAHPLAIATLVIGLVGLLSVDLQIMAANSVQERSTAKLNGTFDSLGDQILAQLNSHIQSASWAFANSSNAAIQKAQDELNDGMFAWVNETTSTLNNTLNEFSDGLAMLLNDTFASTPLFTPMQAFIGCIIGQKVSGIEKALAWMQSNARANFTLLKRDVLMLGREEQEAMVQPVKQMAIGGGGEDGAEDQGIVGKMVGAYRKGLERQRTMFVVFVGLYVLSLVVGTAIVLLDWMRGGDASWTRFLPRKKRLQDDWYTPYPAPGPPIYQDAPRPYDHGISQPLHDDVASLHSRGAPLERKMSPQASSIRHGLSADQISRPIPLAEMDEGVPLGALPPSGPAAVDLPPNPRQTTPTTARSMLQSAASWWFGWEQRRATPPPRGDVQSSQPTSTFPPPDVETKAESGGQALEPLPTKPPRPLPVPPSTTTPFQDPRATTSIPAPPRPPQDASNLFKPRHFSRIPSRSHPHPTLNLPQRPSSLLPAPRAPAPAESTPSRHLSQQLGTRGPWLTAAGHANAARLSRVAEVRTPSDDRSPGGRSFCAI